MGCFNKKLRAVWIGAKQEVVENAEHYICDRPLGKDSLNRTRWKETNMRYIIMEWIRWLQLMTGEIQDDNARLASFVVKTMTAAKVMWRQRYWKSVFDRGNSEYSFSQIKLEECYAQ